LKLQLQGVGGGARQIFRKSEVRLNKGAGAGVQERSSDPVASINTKRPLNNPSSESVSRKLGTLIHGHAAFSRISTVTRENANTARQTVQTNLVSLTQSIALLIATITQCVNQMYKSNTFKISLLFCELPLETRHNFKN
jgi:hypothetical protein